MGNRLEIKNLKVTFGGSFSVGPMTLSVNSGLIYLKGPNGGGKTSLMRAIAGEIQPSSGKVSVAGHDVYSSLDARRQLAFVPSAQELPGFLTVQEAYQFTASLRGVPAWDGAIYCQALDLDLQLPLGHASAGQRRKAELVCALAADPRVLLLDETFSHLDKHSANQLVDWLHEWAESRVILLTHHGEPPLLADQILHVMPGQSVRIEKSVRPKP